MVFTKRKGKKFTCLMYAGLEVSAGGDERVDIDDDNYKESAGQMSGETTLGFGFLLSSAEQDLDYVNTIAPTFPFELDKHGVGFALAFQFLLGRDVQPALVIGRHYVTERDSAPVQYNGIV